jgi:putative nucleotidyltransferase with HDIG domain
MTHRPTQGVVALEVVSLAAAIVAALLLDGDSNWDLAVLGTLLVMAIVSDLTAITTASSHLSVSASFMAIVTATVFLGEAPAALLGVITILGGWLRERYRPHYLLNNLVTYAWFPLLSGLAFHEVSKAVGATSEHALFYLLVFGLFGLALVLNFSLIASYSCYIEGSSFRAKVRRALVPILPSELASAVFAVGIAYAYAELGLAALALFGAVLLIFQRLVGALLLSQERADELELRAQQLAGFQVALLSALLRTLDVRDRMTARHSAAVARYAREIAAQAGLSEEEQELVHTAGLLHDIGKFVLPDAILKTSRRELNEAEWQEIRKHPYEGAQIVAQIDGYAPIGDIILAHHERLDGLGYPRGLKGEEVPILSRVIAVADAYDVMTARDSYRDPVSSYEAIVELRRVSGTQLDERFVEAFIEVLADKDLRYRHGEDADFEAELALDRRIREYVSRAGTASVTTRSPTGSPPREQG